MLSWAQRGDCDEAAQLLILPKVGAQSLCGLHDTMTSGLWMLILSVSWMWPRRTAYR